jgi:hypothetical protein
LTATTVSTSQINLNWQDNSNNETSFEVEWSSDGVNWLSLANVEANITGYNHTGLIPETLYYYQVRARNAAGTSNPSNQANAITLPEEIPPSFTTYLPIIIR